MRGLVAGNWKASCSADDLASFRDWPRAIETGDRIEMFIAVPTLYIERAKSCFPSYIKVGAQDASIFERGSHTGEVCAEMLRECGVEHVILGHSERRTELGETNEAISLKINQVLKGGLRPVLCIGEPQKVRSEKKYIRYLKAQFEESLGSISSKEIDVAYEPAWAIGSGTVPSVGEIAEVVQEISSWMEEHRIKGRILYGGSVVPENAKEIARIGGIRGLLIGGASHSRQFIEIARIFSENFGHS